MIDKVLVPIDLTTTQDKIAPIAKEIGRQYSSSLHLLFVVSQDYLKRDASYANPAMPNRIAKILPAVESKMEQYVADALTELENVTMEVVVGEPAEEVVRYAVEKDMKLILMCSNLQGTGDAAHSVTARVVRTSPVPVLSVNATIN